MKKAQGCNECLHPTCRHSLLQLGVCPCVECDTGVLVLDTTSAPNWKVCCNICNVVLRIFQDAFKVVIHKGEPCECGAKLLAVDFNKGKTPLADGQTKRVGCLFCDEVFRELLTLHHAVGRHPMHRRGRRGKGGRGRGRRGRGRGKGAKGKMANLDNYFV